MPAICADCREWETAKEEAVEEEKPSTATQRLIQRHYDHHVAGPCSNGIKTAFEATIACHCSWRPEFRVY